MQKKLSNHQIRNFHVHVFVNDQFHDFIKLFDKKFKALNVVDIGGGAGFFAKKLSEIHGINIRIIDADVDSVSIAKGLGVNAKVGNAIDPEIFGDEDVACFNLILHHLIGESESETLALQKKSLMVWRGQIKALFVNEYIYESYVKDFSGKLIFFITKNKTLSRIGFLISRFIPSLKANTFGVGVRFRSLADWHKVFHESGYIVQSSIFGCSEYISWPRRFLLIKKIHRVSFLLIPG